MALASNEYNGGGVVRDLDGRLITKSAAADALGQQYGVINTAASGSTQLVAAQGTGLKIKVTSYTVVATGAVAVKFQSGVTDLTGPMSLAANGGVVDPNTGNPYFETGANSALNINLSAAIQVSGHFTYIVEA